MQRRILAAFMDEMLCVVVSIAVFSWISGFPGSNMFAEIASLLFIFVYYVFCHSYYGQTIGKYFFGIKVLRVAEDGHISAIQAIVRDVYVPFLTILSLVYSDQPTLVFVPIIWLLIEVSFLLSNEKSRALHDYWGGSVVVRI
ncbi:MAG: RDD family protein [Bacteroidia bacterium]|nr:RDD family protein [Bacteroidia bacterium]